MKSDKQFLDEIYDKIAVRQKQLAIEQRIAYKQKQIILSISSTIVVIVLIVSTWQIVIHDIRYKATRSDNTVASSLWSGTIIYTNKSELINQSDVIIRGTIRKVIGSRWTNPDNVLGKEIINSINTFYLVDIAETYKGNPVNNKTIILSTPGGVISKTQITQKVFPDLIVGEQVILFLNINPVTPPLTFFPYKDSYCVLGLKQGVYKLDINSGKYLSGAIGSDGVIEVSIFIDEVKNNLD